MVRKYYHEEDSLKNQIELIKSAAVLQEDKLIPSIDGKFNPYRYFKHEIDIQPSLKDFMDKVVLDQKDIERLKEKDVATVIPYNVPVERSYAIVELQDLSSERRITELIYDAVYEGIPISDLKIGLEIIARRVIDAIKSGKSVIILSDVDVLPARVSIPLPFVLPFIENFLSKEGFDFSSISIYIETDEVVNPYEVATLLSLGAKGVYPRILKEEDILDISNKYIFDLIHKKGYSKPQEYINSKDIKIVGLKREFVDTINTALKTSFEVEGISEIESYIFNIE